MSGTAARAGQADLRETLQQVVRGAREMTGAAFGALGLVGPDGELTEFLCSGVDPTLAARPSAPSGQALLGVPPVQDDVLLVNDVRRHPLFRDLPPEQLPATSFLGASVRVATRPVGNLYVSDAPGGFTPAQADQLRLFAKVAGLAVHNARLLDLAGRREARAQATADIALALLSDADTEEALQLLAARAQELLIADAAVLVLPNVGTSWVIEIAAGASAHGLVGTVMPPDGRTARTVALQRGLLVPDLSSQDDLQTAGLAAFGPALYAPMVAADTTVGVLIVLRAIDRAAFDADDLADTEAFAHQATFALALAETRALREATALTAQRTDIARDLHDFVIQEIFATGANLTNLAGLAGAGQFVDAHALNEVADRLDGAVGAVRVAVATLRESGARGDNVYQRLGREVIQARAQLRCHPQLAISAAVASAALPGHLVADLAAIVREGLSNAGRHAQASTVSVCADIDGAELVMEIVDDGVGVPAEPCRRSGLANMAERAERHGGQVRLTAAYASDGQQRPGTRVQVRIPMPGQSR